MCNIARALVCLGLCCMVSFSAWADPGVTDREIVLGQSAAFSGPAAELGIQMNAGARAYFDHVNQQGGVHGRRITLLTLDDKYEPELAATNTRKFIEDSKVFALFGYVGTPTSNAALPIFTGAKVPFFAPFTGAKSLREPFNRHIFNIRASYADETERIVEHLSGMGVRNFGVFYQNDAYGQAGLSGVEQALKKRNMTTMAKATVERNSTEVGAAVADMLAKKPDAVIQIGAYKGCSEFIKAMRKAGFGGHIYNVSFVGSKALADELGEQGRGIGISQVVPLPWHPVSPIVNEYDRIMKAQGRDINFSSLEGFIAARVFVEGLRRAGRDLSRERFIAAMESINSTNYSSGGFPVDFSPTNHSGSKFVEMTLISKNGRFIR